MFLTLLATCALTAQMHVPPVRFERDTKLQPDVVVRIPPGSHGPIFSLAPGQPRAPELRADVVCGMTVISGPSAFDEKMRVTAPTDTQFTIRSVKPPVCNPSTLKDTPTTR